MEVNMDFENMELKIVLKTENENVDKVVKTIKEILKDENFIV